MSITPMTTPIERLGIVGAGQMGAGIAQTAAQSGLHVFLADQSREGVEKAKSKIHAQLKKQQEKGKISETDVSATLNRIQPVAALSGLTSCQAVIEAVSENPELKFKLFKDLSALLPPETLLGSNTSSISITALAAQTQRPDRVIGIHFMNPVPVMKLVEGIRGLQTSQQTVDQARILSERMGKTWVEAKDIPGFAVNRILMPMINEAVNALYEGIASAEGIDTAMKLGTNQPMGPLTLADFIGLDTCLAILEVLHHGLGDPKYRPSPLLKQYVAAGWLGKKTGRGFYSYDNAP
jgi:3-hydroxybutyryl-CoA dehydrogenase